MKKIIKTALAVVMAVLVAAAVFAVPAFAAGNIFPVTDNETGFNFIVRTHITYERADREYEVIVKAHDPEANSSSIIYKTYVNLAKVGGEITFTCLTPGYYEVTLHAEGDAPEAITTTRVCDLRYTGMAVNLMSRESVESIEAARTAASPEKTEEVADEGEEKSRNKFGPILTVLVVITVAISATTVAVLVKHRKKTE